MVPDPGYAFPTGYGTESDEYHGISCPGYTTSGSTPGAGSISKAFMNADSRP
jgi:hypothetical protein